MLLIGKLEARGEVLGDKGDLLLSYPIALYEIVTCGVNRSGKFEKGEHDPAGDKETGCGAIRGELERSDIRGTGRDRVVKHFIFP